MTQRRVADVMTSDVVTATPGTTYRELVALLTERRISGVPVLDHLGRVAGVVSEADLLTRIGPADQRRHWWRRPTAATWRRTADELMSVPAVTVVARAPVGVAAQLMAELGLRRLPVVDDLGRLVGIVSRTDVLRVLLRSDEDIRAEVVGELLRGTDGRVEAEVRDGVVTLRGDLDRREAVAALVEAVRAVDGVVGVRERPRVTERRVPAGQR